MKINAWIRILVLIIIGFYVKNTQAQQNISQMVPLSPNAAAITKYGETPVSHFTGVPNIGVSIYEIQTQSFNLSISLSYHAGGNTVGNVPSWVGMGWNLNTIPLITRSVRGIPDEEGFFYKFGGRTNKQIYDLGEGNADHQQFIKEMALGNADSEPDVFFYSLNGKIGKFVYDQETDSFRTLNKDNIRIFRTAENSFILTDDNGIKYYFSEKEFTTTNQKAVATAWNVAKMVNAQLTDSLIFSYQQHTTTAASYRPNYKYVQIGGTASPVECEQPADNESISEVISTTINNMIDRIIFKGGYVRFIVQQGEREDLVGGHALESVKVFTNQNVLVKDYKLIYGYLAAGVQGAGCVINDFYRNNKWLVLTAVAENAKNGTFQHIHTFEYDDAHIPPCRNSAAQDLWGFYNGAMGNKNLIPTFTIPTSTSPIEIVGADRNVNPTYSGFGMLKRITYPTGGYTDFEFENNVTSFGFGVDSYITKTAVLLGEPIPSSTIYTKTFTVYNAVDPILNANQGGAFLTGRFGDLGCELNGMANICAELYLEGISGDGLGYFLNITSNFAGLLIPNGTYKMTAKFNQSPIKYQSFWYELSWKERDVNFGNNNYLGGLRIKKMASHATSTETPIVKNYRYTTTYDSNQSSGYAFADIGRDYKFILQGVGFKKLPQGQVQVFQCAPTMKVMSVPQNPEVSHSGSFIGYKNVHVFTDSLQMGGLSSYTYSHKMDIQHRDFPYPPMTSQEAFRGQLLEEANYKFSNETYTLVKKDVYTYEEKTEQGSTFALGTDAFTEINNNGAFSELPIFIRIPTLAPYQLYTKWSELTNKKEFLYDLSNPSNFIETSTSYEYDPETSFLKKTESTTSIGDMIINTNYYPKDLYLTGDIETGRQWLVNNNVITPVLKQQTQRGNNVTESVTDYKTFGNVNAVWPAKTIKKINNIVTEEVDYHNYNSVGNLLEYSINDGAKISYQWDVIERSPILEAKNAGASEIFYENFEGVNGFPGNAYMGYKRSGSGYTINWTPPNSKVYRVAYWKCVGTIWSYVENEYPSSNSFTLSGGDYYDEVKVFPSDAHLTTSAYEPLVGIMGRTNTSGVASYFNYDNFNRLETISDHHKNIVKHYSYQIIGNNALWVDTQLTRCQTDGQGRYTWRQEKQQRDDNPRSTTYNQTRWVLSGLSTSCARNIYARIEIANSVYTTFPTNFDPYMSVTFATGDIYIRLYDDEACTIPATYGTDLQVSVHINNDWVNGSSSGQDHSTTTHTIPLGSNSLLLYNIIYYNNGSVPDMMDPSQAVVVSSYHTYSTIASTGNLYTVRPTVFIP